MQKIILSSTILFATIVMGFYLSACNNTDDGKLLKVATQSDSIKYQCPMKDQHDTTYTTAGECPKCGMELTEIKK